MQSQTVYKYFYCITFLLWCSFVTENHFAGNTYIRSGNCLVNWKKKKKEKKKTLQFNFHDDLDFHFGVNVIRYILLYFSVSH